MKRLKRKLHKLILFLLLVFLHDPCYAMTSKECLASAIFHEARGEPIEGQRAVAHVILNRAKYEHKSICAIIKAHKQFSFVHRGVVPHAPKEWLVRAVSAIKAYSLKDESRGATFFIHQRVKPLWSRRKRLVAHIGKHKFYREKCDEKNGKCSGHL